MHPIMQVSNLNHENFLTSHRLNLNQEVRFTYISCKSSCIPERVEIWYDIRMLPGTIKWLRQCGIVIYMFRDIVHGRSDAVLSSAVMDGMEW